MVAFNGNPESFHGFPTKIRFSNKVRHRTRRTPPLRYFPCCPVHKLDQRPPPAMCQNSPLVSHAELFFHASSPWRTRQGCATLVSGESEGVMSSSLHASCCTLCRCLSLLISPSTTILFICLSVCLSLATIAGVCQCGCMLQALSVSCAYGRPATPSRPAE